MKPKKILDNLYLVGSDELSGSGDCLVYALGIGKSKICLIDAGLSHCNQILANINETSLKNRQISHLFLTHCHIDHIGAAHQFQKIFPDIEIFAHSWDIAAIKGLPNTENLTAASWYGINYIPPILTSIIKSDYEIVNLSGIKLAIYHTPGHTPGSISILYENSEKIKILFGQDIHGPFLKEFNSNIDDWRKSMRKLIALEADILCEGHFGIFSGRKEVKQFINSQLKKNSS